MKGEKVGRGIVLIAICIFITIGTACASIGGSAKLLEVIMHAGDITIARIYSAVLITWLGILMVCILVMLWIGKEYKRNYIKRQQVERSENLMVVRFTTEGKVIYTNHYMRKKLGYPRSDFEQKCIADLIGEADRERFYHLIEDPKAKELKSGIDLSFITAKKDKLYTICTMRWEEKDLADTAEVGDKHVIEITAISLEDYRLTSKSTDEIKGLYEEIASSEEEVQKRFDELCEKQEALQISEQRYGLVVETASMGVFDYDTIKQEIFISPKLKEILGVEALSIQDMISKDIIVEADRDALFKLEAACKAAHQDAYEIECRVVKPEGDRWVLIAAKWVRDEAGKTIRVAGAITDIHEKKVYRDKIRQIAYYDELTQLTNKSYIKQKFLKDAPEKCTLIHIDIDNFKFINDSFGYDCGDATIQKIASRLKALVTQEMLISRVSADEFYILMLHVDDRERIEQVLDAIGNIFKEPFQLKDVKTGISYSAGVAIYPYDAVDYDELTTCAGTALHRAKAMGKRRSMFYSRAFKANMLERIHVENNLKEAIKNNEFALYYQPQASIANGEIKGFEALIRWIKPDGSMVPPIKFIDVAEETGLIIPIGAWVIEEACLFINKLQALGYTDVYVAINLSVIQLTEDDFVERIEKILDDTKVNASCLHIEITETILMECIDKNIQKINRIKERGIVISLDDFGKGYSSLTYLKQLPINILKIEKAFVDDIIEDPSKNITGAIVKLGQELGLEVVAEGVEEEAQLQYLKEYNCDIVQGYLISRPIPEQEALAFLETH